MHLAPLHPGRSDRYSIGPGTVAESVKPWSRMREIMPSIPGQVKPMSYQINTCRFIARCLALLG